jgi:hypothetical protein
MRKCTEVPSSWAPSTPLLARILIALALVIFTTRLAWLCVDVGAVLIAAVRRR